MLALLMLMPVVAMATGKQPCCVPRQFEGNINSQSGKMVNGNGVTTQIAQRIKVDYDSKLLLTHFASIEIDTMKAESYVILQDYNNAKAYVTMEDGSCISMDFHEPMSPPCIPDDAHYFGSVVVGWGNSSVAADSWGFSGPGPAEHKLVVTADNCVPITESVYGIVYGEPQQIVHFFFNYSPGIEDSSDMVIPTNCSPM